MAKDKQISIVYLSVNEITPYENNARINDKAVDAVVKSIKEYGFKNPILIDKDNVIIAGHTRLKAAQELKIKNVPCIYADDLTPQQIKAFRIADNKTGEIADWDFDLLEQEMQELIGDGYDIESIGFNDAELEEIISKTVEDMDYYLDLRNGEKEDEEEFDEGGQNPEMLDIDDVKSSMKSDEYVLKLGAIHIVMTAEEYEMFTKAYNEYVDINGVNFGFIRSILCK